MVLDYNRHVRNIEVKQPNNSPSGTGGAESLAQISRTVPYSSTDDLMMTNIFKIGHERFVA